MKLPSAHKITFSHSMIVAMTKVLLVLPSSSYRSSEFVLASQRLNLDITLLTDADTPSILPLDKVIHLPQLRLEPGVMTHIEGQMFDAVVGVDDISVRIAAQISTHLGLPTNPDESLLATTDKVAFRKNQTQFELPQPKYATISKDERDPQRLMDVAMQVSGFPLVIKPISGTQSKGVIRVDHLKDLLQALEVASQTTTEDELLLEEYVEGAEYALEGVLVDSKLVVLAIFDKPEPLRGPFFEESIYITPSKLPHQLQREAERVVQRSCESLGLWTGPVHAEFRIKDSGRLYILEVAARSIGGSCAKALRFGSDTTLEELLLTHASSIESDSTRVIRQRKTYSGVLMLPTPKTGVLRSVSGLEQVRALKYVTSLELTVPVGTFVKAPPLTERYMGFVFADSPGYDSTIETLKRSRELLSFEISDR